MQNRIRRWILAFLSLALLISTWVPFPVANAATLTSPATNLAAATDTSTRDYIGSNISAANGSAGMVTMTVKGGSFLTKQGYLTLTYTGSAKAVVSFDVTTSGTYNSLTIGGSAASGSYSTELSSGGSIAIYMQVASKQTATVTLTGITCKEIFEGPATITYNAYGSAVTVGGTTVPNGGTSATITEAGAEFKATPVSGASFVAWVDKTDNSILSQDATFTLKPYATSMDIEAVFTKSSEPAFFKVGGKLYSDLNAAISAANSGTDKLVVLISSGTLAADTYNIPSGVTFLAPYSKNNLAVGTTTYTDDSGNLNSTLEHANVAFTSDRAVEANTNDSIGGILEPDISVTYTLTVPSDATINVNSGGKMVVGGTVVAGSFATQGICGGTAGAHSNLQLEGTINVNSGGILSATGYIRGSGTINVASGGIVYQPYIMMDHKDGHYVSGAKNEECFPFYRHSLLNIQSKLVLNSGADMYGYVTFFTQEQLSGLLTARYNVTCMHVVGSGTETALYLLGDNAKLEMTYDTTKAVDVTGYSFADNIKRGYYSKVGRTTMTFTGDASLGYMTLSINVMGTDYNMSTETSVFPIPYNYNIIQNSGTFTVNYEMALLPGATFTVANGAALTVASGVNFAVYDGFRDYSIRSESLNLDGDDETGGTWAQFHYPSSANLKAYGFSSTAELIVNGTLNVNGNLGGTVQTGGTTGTIVMGASAGNSVTSVLGVVNEANTISILGKSFDFLGSCGKTTRTLTAQVFPTNKTTPLTLEAGKTYTTTGAGTNTLSSYTYGVYTAHNATAATSETKTDLNATVTGTWCISGHNWADATCTAPQTCSICGATQGDPLAHTYSTPAFTWADDYSCTAVVTCSGCGGTKNLNVSVESVVTTEATCSAEGLRTYTATTTDDQGNSHTDTKTQVIEKLPHTYNEEAVSFEWSENTCTATYICTVCDAEGTGACTVTSETEAATCQKAGQTVYTASITLSGQTYTDTKPVTLDQLAHNYSDPTFAWAEDYSSCKATYTCSVGGESHTVDCDVTSTTENASCTAAGKTTYTASVVVGGTTYTDTEEVTIAQLEHVFTNYTAKDAATCTTKATEIASCDHGCGTTDIRKVGDVLGHSFTNYVSDNNATCTQDGTKTASCDRNGCSETDTVADTGSMLVHAYTTYTYNDDATCQKDGTKTASCDYGCGNQDTVTAEGTQTDHVFGDYVSNNNATCTAAGTKTRTCTFGCGTTETVEDENAPALDHSFTNYISNEDATCLANGTETAKCDRCDATDTREDADSALGHSFTNYVANEDAVCGVDGTKTAKCDRCEATDTVTNEGSALSHSFTNYVSDNNASCLQNGTETASCDHSCGETYTREIEGTKLDHVYTNYVSDGNATCLADGTKTASCDLDCGTTNTVADEGSALGHSHTNYVSDNNATCTTDGTETAVCDRDGCEVTGTRTEADSALGHDYGEYTSNNDASCLTDGTKTAECSRCDATDTITDIGSALDHSFTSYVSNNDATCQKDGTETAVCDRENCDVTDTRTIENSKAPHKYTNYVSNEDATCKADGTKTASCDYDCGSKDTVADEGTKLDHTPVTDEAVEPTCTSTGLTEGSHCTVCGETIIAQEVVPANGHSYDTVVTAPTCTAAGYTTYTCSVCSDTYIGNTTEAAGHQYGDVVFTWSEDGTTATASLPCTVENCGHVEQDEAAVEAISRTDGDCQTASTVTYTATVTLNETEYTDTKIVEGAVGEHNYKSEVTEPTHTTPGYTTYTCTVENCGNSYTDDETAALGHSYGDWIVTTEPTCTETGVETRTCDCGEEETRPVEAAGHKYDNGIYTDPTFESDGYTTFTCTVCGDSYTVTDEGSKLIAVAQVGETKYETLAEAIAAGNEVTLLADAAEEVTVNKAVTINKNGFETNIVAGNGYEVVEVDDNTIQVKVVGDPIAIAYSMQATLTLKNEIFMNVQFQLENLGDIDPLTLQNRVGLLIWNADEAPTDENATVENCSYVISSAEYDSLKGKYIAHTLGIPAKNLGDALSFRAYFIDDEGNYVYGRVIRGYSPKRYCYNMLGDDENDDDALMIAILNYCTSAQEYFAYYPEYGYSFEEAINSGLTDEQKALNWDGSLVRSDWSVPAEKQGVLTRTSNVITSRSASLTLAGAIDYNFSFKVEGVEVNSAEILTWTEDEYNAIDVLTEDNATVYTLTFDTSDSRYRYKYEGLPARQMFSAIYACAKIVDMEGNVYYSGVIPYCPERFAAININSSIAVNVELAKRLVIYGDAARAYFA